MDKVREENNLQGVILLPYRAEFACNIVEGHGFYVLI